LLVGFGAGVAAGVVVGLWVAVAGMGVRVRVGTGVVVGVGWSVAVGSGVTDAVGLDVQVGSGVVEGDGVDASPLDACCAEAVKVAVTTMTRGWVVYVAVTITISGVGSAPPQAANRGRSVTTTSHRARMPSRLR
jgi:hypothetical protein